MKIDIGSCSEPNGREKYFKAWAPGQIISGTEVPRTGAAMRSNVNWLRAIQAQTPEKVILGASGASSIDDLVSGRYTKDRAAVTKRIAESKDELIVLPAAYRLGGWEAQRAIAYDQGTLVRLDSMATKRQLLNQENKDQRVFQNGSFSYREMEEWDMTPEKMLAAAVAAISEDNPEKTRVGYAWRSPSNQGLHIVSLLRCIEGLELRLLQDYAAWKILPHTLEDIGTKKAKAKLRNIERYVELYGAEELLPRLDLSKADLIEKTCAPRMQRRGWHMQVPSRENPGTPHLITINNMPIQKEEQGDLYGLKHTWSVNAVDRGNTEQVYREGRRSGPQAPSKQDFYFTANAIAALHTVRKMHHYQPAGWFCADLPIALPHQALQEHVDALRYRTVILDENSKGEAIVRSLGKTEIEDWLWPRVQLSGFDACLTTRPSSMYREEVKEILQFYEEGRRFTT